jgi:hypothetical protein
MEPRLSASEVEERAMRALDRAFLYEDQESYAAGVVEAVRAVLDGLSAERVSA